MVRLMVYIILLSNQMNIVLMTLGLSTSWLFMYKIEWLLNHKSFLFYIVYSLLLFFLSKMGEGNWPSHEVILVALQMPFYSAIIFKTLQLLFQSIFKRNPVNTFWTFTSYPVQDVVFSMMFWILGTGIPVYLTIN